MDERPRHLPPKFPARLGRRLSFALAIVVLVMLIAAGISLFLGVRTHNIDREAHRQYQHSLLNSDIHAGFHVITSEIQHIQITGQFDHVARLRELQQNLNRRLQTFLDDHRNEPPSDDELLEDRLLDNLSRLAADLRAFSERAAMKFEKGTYLDRGEVAQLRDVVDRGVPLEQDLRRFHDDRVARLFRQDQYLVQANMTFYLAFILFSGLLISLASVMLHRTVAMPLVRVANAAMGIAEGRLDERVPVRSRDEIGQLSNAFNVMADRLQERDGELRLATSKLEQKVSETQALYQIGTEILGIQQLESILKSVADQARELLRADVSVLCLHKSEDDLAIRRTTSGPPDAIQPKDLHAACTLPGGKGSGSAPLPCQIIAPEYLRAHLSVALHRGEQGIGVLCIGNKTTREYSPAEKELLAGLATQASIAIENARLNEESQRAATVEERRRIAQDMHDGLAQTVALLHLNVRRAQTVVSPESDPRVTKALAEMGDIISKAYEEVRQSIYGLRTMVSGGLGLVPNLAEFLHDFSEQYGIPVELEASEDFPSRLPATPEAQIVRIIQEALTNVRKHAKASRAWVRLQRQGSGLNVIIEDDGRGWDLGVILAPNSLHVGLEIMRERAESLQGTLEIQTAPGRGTRVTATIPLENLA